MTIIGFQKLDVSVLKRNGEECLPVLVICGTCSLGPVIEIYSNGPIRVGA